MMIMTMKMFTLIANIFSNLFDFTKPFWVEKWEKNARKGLDDEMLVFQWLDIDAEGDDDDNPDTEDAVFQ
ncbi:hypothetical protein E1B28_008059 [Marasmius oreades]|uniref:Uncharacterized protein n=1 Tax=Marasmius oreades TaxID=181124 RepID=A0A9P7S3F5_9AGAR|nr:uncharacterized protein E1B28_008059 [Marasmius oreades]KAG7094463.1 hypothetical protein E1B28_008059 [Marasmius oreades]